MAAKSMRKVRSFQEELGKLAASPNRMTALRATMFQDEFGKLPMFRSARTSNRKVATTTQPLHSHLLPLFYTNNKQCQKISKVADITNSSSHTFIHKKFDDSQSTLSNDEVKPRHQCLLCPKYFLRKDVLREHQRVHSREKPYACSICPMRFPTKSTLKKHERTHVGDKRFVCLECGLRFSGRSSLGYHLKVHAGIRPFKCQFCSKKFIENSHLKRHVLIHTGEKRFECNKCGLKFRRNCSLQAHVRKHENAVLFLCVHCSRTFRTKESFVYHLQLHTGIRPFRCSVCGFSFIKNNHLRRHLSVVHKKKCLKNSRQKSNATSSMILKPIAEDVNNSVHSRSLHRWPYTCTYCPKRFAHNQGLDSHLKFHEAMMNFNVSRNLFSNDIEMRNTNDNVDSDDGNLSDEILPSQLLCEVILGATDKQFMDKAENSVSATKKKLCSVCGLSFVNNNHLRRHLTVVHSKKSLKNSQQKSNTQPKDMTSSRILKPFIVKDFNNSVHPLHLRLWPYACTYCPKRFAHTQGLDSHLKFHDAIMKLNGSSNLFSNDVKMCKPNENVAADDGNLSDEILPSQLLCEVVLGATDKQFIEKVENSVLATKKKRQRRKWRRVY